MPIAVAVLLTAMAALPGGGSAQDSGQAYCWGPGYWSGLGNGAPASSAEPVAVVGGRAFAQLTAGNRFTCGITSGSRATWCWGSGRAGRLGNGGESYSTEPVAVVGDRAFSQIGAGNDHACGISAGANATWCWGSGLDGQLGNGSLGFGSGGLNNGVFSFSTEPVAVVGGLQFTQIEGGFSHTCGIQAESQAAWCWGDGYYGQLGNGADGFNSSSPKPVAVASGLAFTQIAAGADHTCGIQAGSQAAWCWGYGEYGQLGNGAMNNSAEPVAVMGGLAFTQVTAGNGHTCGIQAVSQAAWCWGTGDYGQLGDGANSTSAEPVAVAGGRAFNDITAGFNHTCATQAGTQAAWCWGQGEYGRLGNGAETSSAEPAAVLGGLAFTQIAAGNDHTCGLSARKPLSRPPPPGPRPQAPLPSATLEQRWLFGSSPVRCLIYSPFTGQWGEVASADVPDAASVNDEPWPKQAATPPSYNTSTVQDLRFELCREVKGDNKTGTAATLLDMLRSGGEAAQLAVLVLASDCGSTDLDPFSTLRFFDLIQNELVAQVTDLEDATRVSNALGFAANATGTTACVTTALLDGEGAVIAQHIAHSTGSAALPASSWEALPASNVILPYYTWAENETYCQEYKFRNWQPIEGSPFTSDDPVLSPDSEVEAWSERLCGLNDTSRIHEAFWEAILAGGRDAQLAISWLVSYDDMSGEYAFGGCTDFSFYPDDQEDPEEAARYIRAFVDAAQRARIVACATLVINDKFCTSFKCQDDPVRPSTLFHRRYVVSSETRPPGPPPAAPPPPPPSGGSAPPQPPAPPIESSSSTAAIVGGVVGGVAAVALLGGAALFAARRRKRRSSPPRGAGTAGGAEGKGVESLSSKLNNDDAGPLLSPSPAMLSQLAGTGAAVGTGAEGVADAASLPFSYITTGLPADAAAADLGIATASLLPLEGDRLLTLIDGKLAALASRGTEQTATSPTGSGSRVQLAEGMQRWLVPWSDITLLGKIGGGSFGRVYAALWRATPVACKILIQADTGDAHAPALAAPASPQGSAASVDLELPEEALQQLFEEASVMDRLRHPNLVQFMGLCITPPCILTEYCARGSLYDVLRLAAQEPALAAQLTWQRRLALAQEAARGLLYLHLSSPQIVHRDVKSPNILVDAHWTAKLADFNLSLSSGDSGRQGGDVLNPRWLAPEVMCGREPGAAADVYAFGLVLWELLTWQLPWLGVSPVFQIRRMVLDGQRPEVPPPGALPGPAPLPPAAMQAYCQLMRDCWAMEAGERPACSEMVDRLARLLEEVAA